MESLNSKYIVVVSERETEPGCWNCLCVEIFMKQNDGLGDTPDGSSFTKIGEYERNYRSMYNTFVPFRQGDQDYALYSRDYTATRVMTLPDCKDVGGEASDACGFCPVDFFVPDSDPSRGFDGTFGFVAGCIWGDDTSWKIEYLDLSKISEGILTREAKFGYVSLPIDTALEEAVCLEHYWVGDLRSTNKNGEVEILTLNDRVVDLSTGHHFYLDHVIDQGCCGNGCHCECNTCKRTREIEEELETTDA